LLALSSRVSADDAAVTQSKAYFKAGAAAYDMGDYLAAIQALEAAYALTPLPAIAFSLAQAARRQYFVSHDRAQLELAIRLFRAYLQEVPSKGRRADAAEALGQLEPLAGAAVAGEAIGPATAQPERTRLMLSCETPGALISLDGGPPASSPVIAHVSPGAHKFQVTAEGFFALERSVEAIAGELVPVEVTLREKPATVIIDTSPAADLYIDGRHEGTLDSPKHLLLPSGTHALSLRRNGYRLASVSAELAPGSTRSISVELQQTGQRKTAYAMFIAGGASLVAGAILTGLAVEREDHAQAILDQREERNITADEFHDYQDATSARDRLRVGAAVSLTGAAAMLITGLVLYAIDQPSTVEAAPSRGGSPTIHMSALDTRLRF
jgi:tetratricopeptide (TPR) repeat protein